MSTSFNKLCRSPGQRKLKCQKLEKQESKLLMQRSMESLKRIISADADVVAATAGEAKSRKRPSSLKRDITLTSLGISFSMFGIDNDDDDNDDGTGINRKDYTLSAAESTCLPPPPPPSAEPVWDYSSEEYSDSSFSQSTIPTSEQEDSLSNFNHGSEYCSQKQTSAATTMKEEKEPEVIEVSPGHTMTLRSSEETWHAILEGNVIRTPCFLCQQELCCINDAELLACAECWVFSPIDYKHQDAHGVCIGVKSCDVQSWLQGS